MLIYESDGFLEAEANDIFQLCRSKKTVTIGEGDKDNFDLQAVLCEYQDNDARRCRAAFFAKSLKRSLVFTVSDAEKKSAWQHGQEVLADLGFELESVNLKLSPAMLEVVLRDVPGLSTPAAARALRTEEMQENGELQKIVDEDPESPQGKKAALKLSAAKRLIEKTELLRQILENTLSPPEQSSEEVDALLAQVKDLTVRLEEAETRAEVERTQKEFSEAVTEAAEKRIQELEEVLVEVETKSSDEIKLKRKIATLQGQVKELKTELEQSQHEMKSERDKQGQFVDDVKSAQATISSLEESLNEKEKALEDAQIQLEEGLAEREELEGELKEAQLRVKVLSKDLEAREKANVQGTEEATAQIKELEEQLKEAQHALEASEEARQELEQEKDAGGGSEELDSLQVQHDELTEKFTELEEQLKEAQHALETAEEARRELEQEKDAGGGNDKLEELQVQHDELMEKFKELEGELEQEASVRRRLERGAVADDKRISELEKELSASQDADASSPDETELSSELASLRSQLTEEHSLRKELESELDDAHKMVDSLEQMIRETEESAAGRRSGKGDQDGRVKELSEQVEQLEAQLEQEQDEQKTLAKELAVAEYKIEVLEEEIRQKSEGGGTSATATNGSSSSGEASKANSAGTRKLPHELRPAPQKGAFFHPDWDLTGLPCKSSEDVLQAWETVFNVQIGIEGYPSQYCMAFVVLLRQGKQKRVCILYRLKMNKHTLVCVPAKKPKDEKSLKKAIDEAIKFLKRSGFEMEKMAPEHIDGTLKAYYTG